MDPDRSDLSKMDFTSLMSTFWTPMLLVVELHIPSTTSILRVLVSQFWFGVKIRFLKRAPLYTFRMREMATTTNMDDC